MSSLMQFRGVIDKRGVGLMFMVRSQAARDWDADTSKPWVKYEDSFEGFIGPDGKKYPHIYVAFRKPKGMCGCWVVFEYNGEKQVPDLSVPITVDRLPRDAKRMSDEEIIKYWNT